MNYLNYLLILALALTLSSVACNEKDQIKEIEIFQQTTKLNRNIPEDIQKIQQYHRILVFGIMELIDDDLFINSVIDLAKQTYHVSETSDYYAYFNEIEAIFSKHGRNLKKEMLKSIELNANSLNDVNIFKERGFSFESSGYSFLSRVFLPSLDEFDYSTSKKITSLSFSKLSSGKINIFENGINTREVQAETLNTEAIWLVSSSILDLKNNAEVDVVALEAGGKKKCKASTSTNMCSRSGKKCKCYYGPTDDPDAIEAEIENFLNGNLSSDYYITD